MHDRTSSGIGTTGTIISLKQTLVAEQDPCSKMESRGNSFYSLFLSTNLAVVVAKSAYSSESPISEHLAERGR